MAFDPITAALNIGNMLLDRLLPDKTANDAAKVELLKMTMSGELQIMVGQMQVNQVEAANQSIFVAGWRPFVGWICGAAFGYAFIVQPALQFLLVAFHSTFDVTKLPVLNLSAMLPVLLGMLGLGAMRSWDKSNAADSGH